MLRIATERSGIGSATSILELIYHATVRNIRKSDGNALMGLAKNIFQSCLFAGTFYVMYAVLGLKSSALRGDFILFIMSGVFLYMTFSKTMGAVAGSEGPASAMMKHAPMTTAIAITSAALSVLYIQTLSMLVILYGYSILVTPIEIYDPVGSFAVFLLAWFIGVSIGMCFLALKPWFPGFVGIASTVFARANMIASGKMLVANKTHASILVYFTWNPLFHAIDQERGHVFINYSPHNSNIMYPIYVSLALLMIGLMGEFYTRRHASASWSARR